jgi:DNA mismatch endonuclease (patch repair protein)
MMGAVRQRDTKPELQIRKLLRSAGVSYRVRNRDLPGSPDIANRLRKWAIFVHGCFWHGHRNCEKTKSKNGPRVPKQHAEFWSTKFSENRKRDAKSYRDLRRNGYKVMIIWECELRRPLDLVERLKSFFSL